MEPHVTTIAIVFGKGCFRARRFHNDSIYLKISAVMFGLCSDFVRGFVQSYLSKFWRLSDFMAKSRNLTERRNQNGGRLEIITLFLRHRFAASLKGIIFGRST